MNYISIIAYEVVMIYGPVKQIYGFCLLDMLLQLEDTIVINPEIE